MNRFINIGVIFTLFAGMLLSSCGGGGGGNSNDNNTSPSDTTGTTYNMVDYFPLGENDSWVYTAYKTDEGNNESILAGTQTIEGTQDINGIQTYKWGNTIETTLITNDEK
jgi:hypothetical protein